MVHIISRNYKCASIFRESVVSSNIAYNKVSVQNRIKEQFFNACIYYGMKLFLCLILYTILSVLFCNKVFEIDISQNKLGSTPGDNIHICIFVNANPVQHRQRQKTATKHKTAIKNCKWIRER